MNIKAEEELEDNSKEEAEKEGLTMADVVRKLKKLKATKQGMCSFQVWIVFLLWLLLFNSCALVYSYPNTIYPNTPPLHPHHRAPPPPPRCHHRTPPQLPPKHRPHKAPPPPPPPPAAFYFFSPPPPSPPQPHYHYPKTPRSPPSPQPQRYRLF
ncbi:hypothetical protein Ahy_A07g034410 [Arachis hypogaea]|uniref:Uncharacterized protein n=1 Tax=Arachis hypogaea TaxID=3818 RepID=A0A445CBV4_ARAHY|nr:hypothetical protein Ahy_A07g034410 [Arachis hypogaea]